ncbi:Peptidase family S41 [Chitinophaga costaii]|uniref:Peptidase family S41 n=1 Tax=Chitinophaga costaii TaxID=1335309 RepID=A0A1C4DF95_9BACT|nr:S41 family peptidase [Chitinophaga costaii]PUZ24607.1 hypothetical protein DCM91_11985 [Chitinophaga costaii]SCC30055.1 Peptidase family S41 [Chitinophaga costaii]
MKVIPLLLSLLLVCGGLQAQSAASQLATEAKVWGLLKYYHPAVAGGQYDWDTVLLHAIPRILNARKTPVITAEIQHLLNLAGADPAPPLRLYDSMAIMYRNFDTAWISDDHNLTDTQQIQLRYIARHPARLQNHYVRTGAAIDSVYAPANEAAYTQSPFPDPAYRLLSLFRYWNVIQHYYPYKYLIGTPWPRVLEPLTEAFLNARDAAAYERALAQMVAAANDSQTQLLPDAAYAVAGRYPAPFTVYIIDNKAVVMRITDSSALKGTDIKPGVVIDEVDGVRLADRIQYLWPYVPASSPGARLRDMQPLLLNSDKPDMTLVCYTLEGRKFKAKCKRPDKIKSQPDTLLTVPPARMLDNNIGYIHFARLHPGNTDSILQTMMKTKAIIFDLREPVTDTTVIYEVPRYLLTDRVPYAFVTAPYFPLPGTFHYQLASHGSDDNHYIGIKSNAAHYPGKIILLVNEHTQDLAEWAAMLLQSTRRATIVGTPTAGALGPVTQLPLADSHQVTFTAQGSYALNGTPIQRQGIPITIPVSIHIFDLQHQQDVILQQALNFINNNP